MSNIFGGFQKPRESESLLVPIILMGPSGCGKSSFINAVLGREVAPTSEGILPATDRFSQYPVPEGILKLSGLQYTFVDTPGLSAHQQHRWAGMSDFDILAELEGFLEQQFPNVQEGKWWIIYLHNVCASKVVWQHEERTMAIFTRLAGGYGFPNLTVVRTSTHGDPALEQEVGLLKRLRESGVQFLCVNNFEDIDAHRGCPDVRTPRELVQDVGPPVFVTQRSEYDGTDSDERSETDSHNYQNEGHFDEGLHSNQDQPPPPPPPAGPAVIQILGGIFNEVQGNQTNHYPHQGSTCTCTRSSSTEVSESVQAEGSSDPTENQLENIPPCRQNLTSDPNLASYLAAITTEIMRIACAVISIFLGWTLL